MTPMKTMDDEAKGGREDNVMSTAMLIRPDEAGSLPDM